MSKHDFTIFRYSTMLALTRAGITTFAELVEVESLPMTERGSRGFGSSGR